MPANVFTTRSIVPLQISDADPDPRWNYADFNQVVDEGETAVNLTLPYTTWDQMGQPEFITITVVPGDTLNGPAT